MGLTIIVAGDRDGSPDHAAKAKKLWEGVVLPAPGAFRGFNDIPIPMGT